MIGHRVDIMNYVDLSVFVMVMVGSIWGST